MCSNILSIYYSYISKIFTNIIQHLLDSLHYTYLLFTYTLISFINVLLSLVLFICSVFDERFPRHTKGVKNGNFYFYMLDIKIGKMQGIQCRKLARQLIPFDSLYRESIILNTLVLLSNPLFISGWKRENVERKEIGLPLLR